MERLKLDILVLEIGGIFQENYKFHVGSIISMIVCVTFL
jgi:hypothetical protein